MSDPGSDNTKRSKLAENSKRSELTDDRLQSIHAQMLRENPEPEEGFSPIPIFLLFVFSGLIFFGGIYIAKYSGGFSALVFNEAAHPHEGGAVVPSGPDPFVLGKRLYTQNCVACHQATGMGLPPVFPPLVDSEWVLGAEQRPIRIVLHGLGGEIEVNGVSFTGAMPAFGPSTLNWSDDEVAAVLSYVRQEWGNAADPVSPDTVAAVRAETEGRTTPWTAAELEPYR